MDTLRRRPLLKGYVTAILLAALAIIVSGCGGGGGGGGDNGNTNQSLPSPATVTGSITDSNTGIALVGRYVVITSGSFTGSDTTKTGGTFKVDNVPTDSTVTITFYENSSATTAIGTPYTLQSQTYTVNGNTVNVPFIIYYMPAPPF